METPRANYPDEIPHLFATAWNARSANDIAALFEEEAEFVNVVGLWWHKREDIRKAHDYGLKTIFNKSLLEVRTVKVKLLSNALALVHARMRLTGQTATGYVHEPGDRSNIFSFVIRKGNEGWRCVSAHNTDVVPGVETNIVDAQGQLKAVDYGKP